MDLQEFLRTLTILDMFRINGYGLYGLIGAAMGCAVLSPKSFREFVVRMSCGFMFSFTLTPLAGPLLGGIAEQNLGPRAAEQLYDSPAGVGILVGMLSYFIASFVLHVAKFSKEDVERNQTTYHDIKKRHEQSQNHPPVPVPTPAPVPTPPDNTPSDIKWPDPDHPAPNHPARDIWSL